MKVNEFPFFEVAGKVPGKHEEIVPDSFTTDSLGNRGTREREFSPGIFPGKFPQFFYYGPSSSLNKIWILDPTSNMFGHLRGILRNCLQIKIVKL